uniref:G-protein coupled receptors family 1 profile domain-containing protein n=1 Tax=Sphenodon punctatus TaxID=8508 RepID=A0A8D0H1T1_SPHPU
MECENDTAPMEFILAGIPYPQELKIPFFLLFLLIYLLTLFGNTLILFAVASEPQLHKPMYWFLCHLSILDMTASSVVEPKLIAGFVESRRAISFKGCVTQLFFYHFLGCAQCFLYTVMAFDRFLAICRPLHYVTIMNRRSCLFLSLGTCIGGCIHSFIETGLTFRLPYGRVNEVGGIFCEIRAMLKLACADTMVNEITTMLDVGLVTMTCFLLILTSYVYIVSAILKIRTADGRRRAFSTCTVHLILVVLFYVPVVFNYLGSGSEDTLDGMVVSLFFTAVTPLLNPIIYTLRKEDMKRALNKLMGRKVDPEKN